MNFPEFDTTPKRDTAGGPKILPRRGYTEEQLVDYIKRQLGGGVWNVELTGNQILDNVQSALAKLSVMRPKCVWGGLKIDPTKHAYLEGYECQGVAEVTFVESRIGPMGFAVDNPFVIAATVINGLGISGMGDYDMYLRWRETWKTVTSVKPRWYHDEARKTLWIYNPLSGYECSVMLFKSWDNTGELTGDFDPEWVKDYALARCSLLLGENWSKFSGAIPGPGQNIQLDTNRIARAEAKIEQLEEKLRAAQLVVPISFD